MSKANKPLINLHVETYKFQVRRNERIMLRIINAALNTALFFKVAKHRFTVVGVDAAYTTPYATDVVVIAPGQTVDALMVAGAAVGRYYMAASPYDSAVPQGPAFSKTTATAIIEYAGSTGTASPHLPVMPAYTDTDTAFRFFSNLTALVIPGNPTVPLSVDTHMFVTIGLGVSDCQPDQFFCNRSNTVFSSSMNNASFVLPKTVSMLQAQYRNAPAGVYTRDFPDRPPVIFDYTADASDDAVHVHVHQGEDAEVQRDGGDGAAGHAADRQGEPPHAHPRPQLLRARAGIRQL
jgi:laccase